MSTNNNQPQSPREYPANNYIPVRIFRRNRAPLTTDYRNFVVRDFWNDTSSNDLWYLTDKAAGVATWINLGGSGTGDVQFLEGDTGGPVAPDGSAIINTIGGTGCTTLGDPGTNTMTFNVVGGGLKWIEITVAGPTTLSSNTGYVTNNAVSTVLTTLPSTAAFGDVIRISGKGAAGWSLGQNAGQTIHFGNVSTTTGVGGSIASTMQYDCLELVCITQDTDFNVLSSIGVLTVT